MSKFSTSQFADKTELSLRTVQRAIKAGTLIPTRTTPGGHHRFSQAKVDKYNKEQNDEHEGLLS